MVPAGSGGLGRDGGSRTAPGGLLPTGTGDRNPWPYAHGDGEAVCKPRGNIHAYPCAHGHDEAICAPGDDIHAYPCAVGYDITNTDDYGGEIYDPSGVSENR